MKKIIELLDPPWLKERSLPFKLSVIFYSLTILAMALAVIGVVYDKFIA